MNPHEFVRYGLACLETAAARGDECARECRERIRIMVSIITYLQRMLLAIGIRFVKCVAMMMMMIGGRW